MSSIRKSSRQKTPNPIYQQGISELINENTSRQRRKVKNNEESNASYEDENNSHFNNEHSHHHNESREHYLPCRLPGGAQLRVKFVVGSERHEEKRKEKEHVAPVQKTPPPPKNKASDKKQTSNLLHLFIQAIEEADVAPSNQNQNPSVSQAPFHNAETPKYPPMRKKPVRVAGEDFIKSVAIESGNMRIIHSQLNEVNVPIEWYDTSMHEQPDQEVEEIKMKLQACKILKNISILTA